VYIHTQYTYIVCSIYHMQVQIYTKYQQSSRCNHPPGDNVAWQAVYPMQSRGFLFPNRVFNNSYSPAINKGHQCVGHPDTHYIPHVWGHIRLSATEYLWGYINLKFIMNI